MHRLITPRLAVLLVLTLVTVPGTVIAAPQDHQPSAEAAGVWIAEEYQTEAPRFDQFGLVGARAEIIFALAASGTEYATFHAAFDDLLEGADGYVGAPGSISASATGKVLLAASVAGAGPAEIVPGRDLAAELLATIESDGSFADEFSGPNVFTQSLAILGLASTEAGAPTAAVEWLTGAQCSDGAFQFDASCPVAIGSEDPDSTGLATLALVAVGANDAAATAADWLEANQAPDGSAISGFGANANSTAVAAQAFRATGRSDAASAAADFLVSLQIDSGTDAGAIRYLATDTTANGSATLQAVPGLVAGSFLDLTAPEPIPVPFGDVSADSTFATEIGWLGGTGITRGCNPPVNDLFCPDDLVTRGQMAAFLARVFGLDDPGGVGFIDIDGNVFAGDIRAIANVGVTIGCNPPTNDAFCPDDPVTRGQMAAFLVRAYDLTEFPSTGFVDDDTSVFEQDILHLKASGITLGCNPPTNDAYCPDDPVTRGQMAAFLYRARDL